MESAKTLMSSPSEEANTNQDVTIKSVNASSLLYRIDENPPWYLSIMLGFQHYLTMFGATVGMPFILSQYLCFANDPKVISEVMSTLFFCSGLVTLLQSTFGVRLPIVQGATFTFLAPTIAIMDLRQPCSAIVSSLNSVNTTSANLTSTIAPVDEEWKIRMREIQGAIIISSLFQIVIGFSGIMGVMLRFIGPLTIAPTIALVGLPLFNTAGFFAGSQWGIAIATMICITLFSQVLKNINVPLGFTRLQIFKLFPVLLSIIVCWILSVILTASGVFKEGSAARTDYRSSVLQSSAWFYVPYPGQWGRPTISAAAVFGMLSGVLGSMIESIGDYYACARLSGAPAPPKHAINRGLGFEGLGCLITGLWGTGNGTTSYSENIGAIGITRVGSVRVIQFGALIMIVLSLIGKFGALFVTVPNPVIGGIFIIMFGMITAVGVSSLQFVDMESMRNLFIIGTSLFFGMVLPTWVQKNGALIDVGSGSINQILRVFLSTNMAVGGITGFILDNCLPGTNEERGILKWQKNLSSDGSVMNVASVHVYDPPFLPKHFMRSKFCKYVPFLPYYGLEEETRLAGKELAAL